MLIPLLRLLKIALLFYMFSTYFLHLSIKISVTNNHFSSTYLYTLQVVTFHTIFLSLDGPFPSAIDYWKVLEHWKFPSGMPTIIWMMTDHKTARHSCYISQSMCLCTSFNISICPSLFFLPIQGSERCSGYFPPPCINLPECFLFLCLIFIFAGLP